MGSSPGGQVDPVPSADGADAASPAHSRHSADPGHVDGPDGSVRVERDDAEHAAEHSTSVAMTGRDRSLEPRFPDPGLPAHVYRTTDVDPRAAKRAERQVAGLFALSAVGTIIFLLGYILVPLHDAGAVRLSTQLLGGGLALSMFCIGVGAIHWAKKLMPDDEVVEERHPVRSTDEERAAAAAILRDGGAAAGVPRRKLITGSFIGAMALLPIPLVAPLAGLWIRNRGQYPPDQLAHTAWHAGVRLVGDPTGLPIRAAEVPIGAVVHVLPEVERENPEAPENEHAELTLNEIAKAATLLIRLEPQEILPPTVMEWTYNGLVAYSKICTHVGCPVGLYEQTTHHLLCPCHQSTFDVARGAAVVFGPAGHPLPQLALAVDAEGYLIARHDYTVPVGPSYWERG